MKSYLWATLVLNFIQSGPKMYIIWQSLFYALSLRRYCKTSQRMPNKQSRCQMKAICWMPTTYEPLLLCLKNVLTLFALHFCKMTLKQFHYVQFLPDVSKWCIFISFYRCPAQRHYWLVVTTEELDVSGSQFVSSMSFCNVYICDTNL